VLVAESRVDPTQRPFLLRRLLFLELGQLAPVGGSCDPTRPCQLTEALGDLVTRARGVGLTAGAPPVTFK
jgi:hypothetical protein